MDALRTSLQVVLQLRGNLVPITPQKLRDRWQGYLAWLRDVLHDFEAYHTAFPKHDGEVPQSRSRRWCAARICCSPSCLTRASLLCVWPSTRIASRAVEGLSSTTLHAQGAKTRSTRRGQRPQKALMKLKRLPSWRYGASASASRDCRPPTISLGSTSPRTAWVRLSRWRGLRARQLLLATQGKRIAGVDPGTIDFFSAVDGADAKVKCSTSEYYYRARFNQSKALRERKLHNATNAMEEWQGAIPPSRTSSVASIQAHVAYVTPRLQEALAFHGTHKRRHQR